MTSQAIGQPASVPSTHDAPQRDRDAFITFSFLWAGVMLIHQLARHKTWFYLDDQHLMGWLLTLSAALVLLRPSSLFRLAFMLAMDVATAWDRMPQMPNHILFNAMVSLTILLALVEMMLRTGIGRPIDRGALLRRFAPIVRIELMLLYVFVVLAKLNVDFFNPQVSCGATMYQAVQARLHVLPKAEWALIFSIWTTLITEALLPVLLAVRGLRKFGIILGAIFHFMLSVHPIQAIYSFSAMIFALYFLFAPDDLAHRLKQWWSASPRRKQSRWLDPNALRRVVPMVVLIIVMLAGAVLVVKNLGGAGQRAMPSALMHDFKHLRQYIDDVGFCLWLVVAMVLLGGFCWSVFKFRLPEDDWKRKLAPQASLGWLVILLIIFNGMNPYLGLRTETAFAMFSNLRTEGGRTNHFFMSPNWHIADYQDDLVQVLDSSDPRLQARADNQLLLTYFTFHKRTSAASRPFRVRYVRNGREYYFDSAAASADPLLQRPPWWQLKFLHFRPIDREGPMQCRH